ncbi:hypothetical protein M436DRAFT_48240, partial [Aureobasidium namibiae CBS 147.97]
VSSTYGHSQLKTGHPVRSAIHKQLNGRLVLRWVTTWESLLLYVLRSPVCSWSKILFLVCVNVDYFPRESKKKVSCLWKIMTWREGPY